MGRRLGQHFLIRKSVLERIALVACPCAEPLVVEIGPGRGALTEHLLRRAEQVVAIETDALLIDLLGERFSGAANLTLVHGDVLEVDLGQWGPAVITGNLPYYITSPILRKVMALGQRMRRAVFLLQKEVADRLTAGPGTRAYGFLTVLTQLFTAPELLFSVPPSAFRPPPKVDSAVVRLLPRPDSEKWVTEDPAHFLDFVGKCFRQKRKTIRNNLAGLYDKTGLEASREASLRAEQLSIPQFVELYTHLTTGS